MVSVLRDQSDVRIRATVIECKLQFGLGVLAIPSVLHTLGFVPGILCIVIVAIMTACKSNLCRVC